MILLKLGGRHFKSELPWDDNSLLTRRKIYTVKASQTFFNCCELKTACPLFGKAPLKWPSFFLSSLHPTPPLMRRVGGTGAGKRGFAGKEEEGNCR